MNEPLVLLDLAGRELLLFAGAFIVAGSIGELAIDVLWLALRLRGQGKATPFVSSGSRLQSRAAILIPCWNEAAVIGETLQRCSQIWDDPGLRFYIGCYPNDPATQAVVDSVAATDPRMRRVMVAHPGPTTKGDCLNTLWAAAIDDEPAPDFVVLHDAEDICHPDALALIEQQLAQADFVQLPVKPLISRTGRLVSGHYADEFAESHGKTMVVRDWLRTSLPAAGVGCAFRTDMLRRVAAARAGGDPFDGESLTEDYELGLLIGEFGGTARFARARDRSGDLIATRSYFPNRFAAAGRQKARWIGGIAFRGWDRMGWGGTLRDAWMRWRDRRGPLSAAVTLAAYLYLAIAAALRLAEWLDCYDPPPLDWTLRATAVCGIAALAWRAVWRFAFTTAAYGVRDGLLSFPRMLVGNFILMASSRRAFADYLAWLGGRSVGWDKTDHFPTADMNKGAR